MAKRALSLKNLVNETVLHVIGRVLFAFVQMFALEKLKNDLKNHLANMKSELIELINQDCSYLIMLVHSLIHVAVGLTSGLRLTGKQTATSSTFRPTSSESIK